MKLANQFPALAEVLTNIRDNTNISPEQQNEMRQLIEPQIKKANDSAEAIAEIANLLFPSGATPENLLTLSQSFFHYLGIGDHVSDFAGILWSHIMISWTEDMQRQCIFSALTGGHHTFNALEYLARVFTKLCLPPAEMMAWFQRAHKVVENDGVQQGFWRCVEAYTQTFPNEAFALAQLWFEQGPSRSDQIVLSRILGILRDVEDNKELDSKRISLEQRISSEGRPAWRECCILSWLPQIPHKIFSSDVYAALKKLAEQGPSESGAWRQLLCSIVMQRKDLWENAFADLNIPSSNPICRYWTGFAALEGYQVDPEGPILRKEWETLFLSLLPFDPDHESGLVQLLAQLLNLVSDKQPNHLHILLPLIANAGGNSWLALIEGDAGDHFEYIFKNLPIRQALTTSLCLGQNYLERRTGLWLLRIDQAMRLDISIVQSASPERAELLFCETQRSLIDGKTIAQIHAALCLREMKTNASFEDDLRSEMRLQALNSYDYRVILKTRLPADSPFLVVLTDVEEEFVALKSVLKSPALQMAVPMYSRAEGIARAKMSREVVKLSGKKSALLSMVKKVQLLYGKTWRNYSANNGLSEASGLQEFSHSFEVPLMEFIDPERMILRRFDASRRIQVLERQEAHDDK
jgi:hypothetical protein